MLGRGEKMLDEIASSSSPGGFWAPSRPFAFPITLFQPRLAHERAHSRAFDKTARGDANDAALIAIVLHVNRLGGAISRRRGDP